MRTFSTGGLIQACRGSAGGFGGRRTNRSGLASEKRFLPRRDDVFGLAVVDHCWSQQTDPRMTMLVVVVAEEVAAEYPSVLNTSETFRKLRTVFPAPLKPAPHSNAEPSSKG